MQTGTSATNSHTRPVSNGPVSVPQRGCASNADGSVIKCNWDQMATPTCPVPGDNVAMPDGCRPRMLLVLL